MISSRSSNEPQPCACQHPGHITQVSITSSRYSKSDLNTIIWFIHPILNILLHWWFLVFSSLSLTNLSDAERFFIICQGQYNDKLTWAKDIVNLPLSYQCVRERERPHHVERRVTIRRSESPAPAAALQRPGSSQSLPRQGASPAMGRSMNKKGNLY